MNSVYDLSLHDKVLSHGRNAWRLHDQDVNPQQGKVDKLAADALIASGDYFGTLATRLDSISIQLALTNEPIHLELERLINTLLYLEQTYRISKKSKP